MMHIKQNLKNPVEPYSGDAKIPSSHSQNPPAILFF